MEKVKPTPVEEEFLNEVNEVKTKWRLTGGELRLTGGELRLNNSCSK